MTVPHSRRRRPSAGRGRGRRRRAPRPPGCPITPVRLARRSHQLCGRTRARVSLADRARPVAWAPALPGPEATAAHGEARAIALEDQAATPAPHSDLRHLRSRSARHSNGGPRPRAARRGGPKARPPPPVCVVLVGTSRSSAASCEPRVVSAGAADAVPTGRVPLQRDQDRAGRRVVEGDARGGSCPYASRGGSPYLAEWPSVAARENTGTRRRCAAPGELAHRA